MDDFLINSDIDIIDAPEGGGVVPLVEPPTPPPTPTPTPTPNPFEEVITFDYNGQQWPILIKKEFSAGDIVIASFLGFICFYIITKTILELVFKRRISIIRNY